MRALRRILPSLSSLSPFPVSSAAPPARAPQSFEMSTPTPPTLNKPRHVKYWLRCLNSCLPTEYTATDLNRTLLACFCIAALDLLGELHTATSAEDRALWADWIYRLQLPAGGFRGSPATDFGTSDAHPWDPPTLPGSFFALSTLIVLGDDLERVKRRELLLLLPRLQRPDGSFGEWLQPGSEEIVGSTDMRFVYFAAAIRWMLRGRDGTVMSDVEDFDVERAIEYIRLSETYDHGIAGQPFEESHGGHTYCALAALSLLGRLHTAQPGVSSRENVIRWLVQRQVPFEARDGYEQEDYDEVMAGNSEELKAEAAKVELGTNGRPLWGGFNGRCNKRGDTCYSFWVGASLDMLKKLYLIDVNANRRFLLEKTQHVIGGFAKLAQPGIPPDILHSFLGLAALALMREEGLNRLDAALCVSLQAKERLMALPWWGAGH